MTLRTERAWTVFQRGELRDEMLAAFALGLRTKINPKTKQLFTEDEIRRALAQGGRFYVEADAIDLAMMAVQKRDEHTASQVRLDQAASPWLYNYHGDQWEESPLPAFGGSGPVLALANPGVIWQGSTIAGDPVAVVGTDPTGKRFQVFLSATTPANGQLTLTVLGLDTGTATNLAPGTAITWSNAPVGAQPVATVAQQFTGGTPKETDREFAARVKDRIRHKQGAGNWAHLRAMARQASPSVEDAFVYPCALHAGSVIVVPVQRRGTAQGPFARLPNLATMTAVSSYLVPPGSPVVPGRAFMLVVAPGQQFSSGVLLLGMLKASAAGWADRIPFPYAPNTAVGQHAIVAATVGAPVTAFTLLNVRGFTDLPGQAALATLSGANAPQMMAWNPTTLAFEKLAITSVEDVGAGAYDVVLSQPVSWLTSGVYVSPYTARAASLGSTIVQYFDSLGPGELVDLAADVRGGRAFRNPIPAEQWPQRAGQQIITYLFDALGSSLGDATLAEFTETAPSLPLNITDGPRLLTPQHMGVYELGGP